MRFHGKYNQERTVVAGFSFASKLEAALYQILALREKAGEITDLKCQPHVFLTDARIEMIPDFSGIEEGKLIYYEAKGFQTDVWRIKRRLWTVYGPGPLRVFQGTAKKLKMTEEIIPREKKALEMF